MKLAIVIGHNSSGQGAERCDLRQSEYEWNGGLAEAMEAIAHLYGIEAKIFRRPAGVGYSTEIARVYGEVDDWGADASMELHFNAASATATGCEMLSSGTPASLALAGAVQDAVLARFGLRDRGVKILKSGDRGHASVVAGAAPAIITEPFFGSNASDCAVIGADVEDLAAAQMAGVAEYFGAELAPQPDPERPEITPEQGFWAGLFTGIGIVVGAIFGKRGQGK